jgi:ribonuclease T1
MRLVADVNLSGVRRVWLACTQEVRPWCGMVWLVLLLAVAGSQGARAADDVSLNGLPVEARQTYQLILNGGPFPFSKDGVVFGNRERQLPSHARGYYREYTVVTPGSRDRGARRIVCGGRKPVAPDVCYYTQDHYASFRRIAP